MPKEKEKKTGDTAPESSGIDREVLDVIQEEKHRLSGGAGSESAERERILKLFSGKAVRAIQAKDARIFTELLRQAGILEGSPEWKNAWKAFYSA